MLFQNRNIFVQKHFLYHKESCTDCKFSRKRAFGLKWLCNKDL